MIPLIHVRASGTIGWVWLIYFAMIIFLLSMILPARIS